MSADPRHAQMLKENRARARFEVLKEGAWRAFRGFVAAQLSGNGLDQLHGFSEEVLRGVVGQFCDEEAIKGATKEMKESCVQALKQYVQLLAAGEPPAAGSAAGSTWASDGADAGSAFDSRASVASGAEYRSPAPSAPLFSECHPAPVRAGDDMAVLSASEARMAQEAQEAAQAARVAQAQERVAELERLQTQMQGASVRSHPAQQNPYGGGGDCGYGGAPPAQNPYCGDGGKGGAAAAASPYVQQQWRQQEMPPPGTQMHESLGGGDRPHPSYPYPHEQQQQQQQQQPQQVSPPASQMPQMPQMHGSLGGGTLPGCGPYPHPGAGGGGFGAGGGGGLPMGMGMGMGAMGALMGMGMMGAMGAPSAMVRSTARPAGPRGPLDGLATSQGPLDFMAQQGPPGGFMSQGAVRGGGQSPQAAFSHIPNPYASGDNRAGDGRRMPPPRGTGGGGMAGEMLSGAGGVPGFAQMAMSVLEQAAAATVPALAAAGGAGGAGGAAAQWMCPNRRGC